MTKRRLTMTAAIIAVSSVCHGGSVLYVEDNARPGGDGQSWDTAFRFLQDALAAAEPGSGVQEIRIAQGVYRPDESAAAPTGTGSRSASFNMLPGVSLVGGFAGLGAADRNELDSATYHTILSGDLLENDTASASSLNDNSYHVVKAIDLNDSVMLSGLVIQAGNANGSNLDDRSGGGIFFHWTTVHIHQCIIRQNRANFRGAGLHYIGSLTSELDVTESAFIDNRAQTVFAFTFGGGAYVSARFLNFDHCSFTGNIAGSGGAVEDNSLSETFYTDCDFEQNMAMTAGAMNFNEHWPRVLDRCTFVSNTARSGGAIFARESVLHVTDCTFITNRTVDVAGDPDDGGAIVIRSDDQPFLLSVTRSRFVGNEAGDHGGAIQAYAPSDDDSETMIAECEFIGNVAGREGGAVHIETFTSGHQFARVRNCTVAFNHAVQGGGGIGIAGHNLNLDASVDNCIVWGNTSPVGNTMEQQIGWFGFSVPTYSYSCVQGQVGDHGGIGNIGDDPAFIDPSGSDGTSGTLDDNLRLTVYSSCIDSGLNSIVPADALIDADGNPRILDGDGDGESIVDMGAFEHVFVPPVTLALDIKPGDCPNMFNRNSNGVLPVALMGEGEYDVTNIDLSTVVIQRVDGVGGSLAPNEGPPGPHSTFADLASPMQLGTCECAESNADGIVDLSMKFRSDDLVESLELMSLNAGALVPLVVTGAFTDGTFFEAYDCIRIVPPGTPPGMLMMSSTDAGAWLNVTPLDDVLDGGGFTPFERTFPLGSFVRITAPKTHNGGTLIGWRIDGEWLAWPGLTLANIVIEDAQQIEAVYSSVPAQSAD